MPLTTPEDMSRKRAWTERYFSSAADLPVSFVFDGKAIRGIPKAWHPVSTRRRIDANIIETIIEGKDAKTGLTLRVEVTEYLDYPVVEWVAWFTNTGMAPTPVIRDILALDGTFGGSAAVLYHWTGDGIGAEGYAPQETALPAGAAAGFSPGVHNGGGGRPCSGEFPYYRIAFAGWGLTLAIGWPAQWSARFEGLADGVQVRAGQEKTSLRLMPGERIRTPRMTVLAWSGDGSRAVNLWRRWYLAHLLPRPNGQPMKPLLACATTGDGELTTESATEENQIRHIEKFKQRGIDPNIWWMDAGWYPCYNKDHQRTWMITGTWEPDPERFPRGLKPVSDCAARNGADLLLWFEPERVWFGPDRAAPSKIELEHPECLLRTTYNCDGSNDNYNGLLNLGNPECRQWLTDHVCRLINDNGVKVYRQDFNFAPLHHWRRNEAEGRQGLNENLYVQGYLQFWDDLLARNPGLWLDSCASGGRRNDLESLRRSVPLHYSDYGYGEHPVKLAFQHTLYEWFPYFKEFTLSWDIGVKAYYDNRVDSYSYHCAMAAMLWLTLDIRRDDYDYALARKMIAIWRRAAGLILEGDYYPHTPFHRSAEKWVVRQFDCPETGCGLIQGIRLPAAPEATFTLHPKGLCPDRVYVFENAETGETQHVAGEDLIRNGFPLALPARSGAIWFYQNELRTR